MVTTEIQLRKPMIITLPSKFVISPLFRNMMTIKENETGYRKRTICKRFPKSTKNRREHLFIQDLKLKSGTTEAYIRYVYWSVRSVLEWFVRIRQHFWKWNIFDLNKALSKVNITELPCSLKRSHSFTFVIFDFIRVNPKQLLIWTLDWSGKFHAPVFLLPVESSRDTSGRTHMAVKTKVLTSSPRIMHRPTCLQSVIVLR
jgi:hypothetical protein